MNGLPFCKQEHIGQFVCIKAVEDNKLSTSEYAEAVAKCAEADKDCFDKAYDLHPCGKYVDAADICIHSMSDTDQDTLSNYKEEYRLKYTNL